MPIKPTHLLNNPRFYLLASSVCLSVIIVCWLRLAFAVDQLFYIRTEQVFGYLAILYWYCALLITPITKSFSPAPMLDWLTFSRRTIGVSAAYFALLHIVVAFWGQIGGLHNLSLLPNTFLWSFLLGAIAFLILALMAATSFDRVIQRMTFPRWKRLHRFGYLGGILAMLHLWIIGTHLTYYWLKVLIFLLLSLLCWLEAGRLARTIIKRCPKLQGKTTFLAGVLWLSASAAILMLPNLVSNYNDTHHGASLQKEESK